MRSRALLLALLAATGLGATGVAHAGPQPAAPAAAPDPRAEALNEEGKALYLEQKDFAAAVARFRAALAITPDPRYSYNLCAALEKLGQLDDALGACVEVFNHDPTPELAEKAGKRAAAIRGAMKARAPVPPGTVPAPDAPGPPPAAGPGAASPAAGPGPGRAHVGSGAELASGEPDLYEIAPTEYRWALGAALGGVSRGSLGNSGFGTGGVALRLAGEVELAREAGIGLEPYLGLIYFGRPAEASVSHSLGVFDVGAAVTWHRRLWRSLDLTCAGGLQLSFLSASNVGANDSYAALGLRLEAGVAWVFGDGTHVLTVVPIDLTAYSGGGQVGGVRTDASEYGLDHGGLTWTFLVGYRARFQSALPLLNLE